MQAAPETYINDTEINSGGYGVVFRCNRVSDGQLVARKVLHADTDRARSRFKREVQILSKLDHAGIVRVLDSRLNEDPQYFVMPLYTSSLADELGSVSGKLQEVVPIFEAILDAMEYAHSLRVIHRDLKPGNILVNSAADVVVADFGFGKELDRVQSFPTASGTRLGTYRYAAPEQLTDAAVVDHRSDIYSLGMILEELFAGPAGSLSFSRSKVPPSIRGIVDVCTAIAPNQRYQSIGELKHDWNEWVATANRDSELAKLDELAGKFRTLNAGEREELLTLLSKYSQEKSVLEKIFMRIGSSGVRDLFVLDAGGTRPLVVEYCAQALAERHSWEYVDRVADFCEGLYGLIPAESESRAHLLECISVLSVSHNRFHAQRIARRLLLEPFEQAARLAFRMRMSASHFVREIYDLIWSEPTLAVEMRRLFENILLGGDRPVIEETPTDVEWQQTLQALVDGDDYSAAEYAKDVKHVSFVQNSRTIILEVSSSDYPLFYERVRKSIETAFLHATGKHAVVVVKVFVEAH